MFERLSDGFSSLFRKLSGKGSISESNVRDAMGDVRRALLEADVNLNVVEAFTSSVMQDAVGREVTKSLEPGQEMIGIVYRRLVEVLGGEPVESEGDGTASALGAGVLTAGTPGLSPPGLTPGMSFPGAPGVPMVRRSAAEAGVLRVSPGPTVVMMCGLQGSGKTTTCGKLAAYLKKRGRSVLLAAADLQRPAAVEQLETIARQVETELPGGAQVHFYGEPDKVREYGKAVGVAVDVCRRAHEHARKNGIDTLILDTAGRLHVNDELMGELQQVRRFLQPHQIFLVVDAMTGQDAVTSAQSFHTRLEVDGIVLTKFDSDTRGGAALSVRRVTGAPIKFIGVGEKLDALEEFHAERIASRILGMGDVVSLVEKAQEQVSEQEAEKLQKKLAKGEMTMEDFLSQLRTLRRMGPLKQLLGLLPGVGAALKEVQIEDKQLDRVEAMINSMTPAERRAPSLIDNSRRKRIASGSATQQNDVGQMVKQFQSVNRMMKQFGGTSPKERAAAMKEMSSGGAIPGVGPIPGMGRGKGTSYTPSVKDRFKKRKR